MCPTISRSCDIDVTPFIVHTSALSLSPSPVILLGSCGPKFPISLWILSIYGLYWHSDGKMKGKTKEKGYQTKVI